jgi:hypothetical protein
MSHISQIWWQTLDSKGVCIACLYSLSQLHTFPSDTLSASIHTPLSLPFLL